MYYISHFGVTGVASVTGQSYADTECVQSVLGYTAHPAMLQFAKTRKLSFERSEPRKYVSSCFDNVIF